MENSKRTKRIIVIVLIAVLVIGMGTAAVLLLLNSRKPAAPAAIAPAKDEAAALANKNYVTFDEGFTEVKVTDENTALDAVASVADTLGINEAVKNLRVSNVQTFDGDTFYRMQQYCNGLPVYGRDVILVADSSGTVVSLSSNAAKIDGQSATGDPEAKANFEKIIDAVESLMHSDALQFTNFTCTTLPQTVYYSPDGTSVRTCFTEAIRFNDANGRQYDLELLVDTETYEILDVNTEHERLGVSASGKDIRGDTKEFTVKQDGMSSYIMEDEDRNIKVFSANGNTLVRTYALADRSGKKYIISEGRIYDEQGTEYFISDDDTALVDRSGRIVATEDDLDYDWYFSGTPANNITPAADTSTTWKDPKAVTAMSTVKTAYDFYHNELGRRGFDARNGKVYVFFDDAMDGDSENAYSSTNVSATALSIGADNSMEIDVLGHEYTHSVINSIVELPYRGEAGALNEAYADIFGEIIEDYRDGGLDNSNDWQLSGFRDIADPEKDGNPSVYQGKNWASTFSIPNILRNTPLEIIDIFTDNGGVHTNSTVISHAAYLMQQGIDGTEDSKISTDLLAKIWYRSMFSLHSDETFAQCAAHVYEAAARTKELSDRQLQCVREAFETVGLPVDTAVPFTAARGAEIHVINKTGVPLNRFHVVVTDDGGAVVDEQDAAGSYVLNEKEGTYVVTVSDSSSESSEPFAKCIHVIPAGDNDSGYVNILTDYE